MTTCSMTSVAYSGRWMNCSDRIWRIVEGTVETEFESLYLVYATALVDGGAIDVIGFYPPGFEALDFSTLLDMMATFEPVQ